MRSGIFFCGSLFHLAAPPMPPPQEPARPRFSPTCAYVNGYDSLRLFSLNRKQASRVPVRTQLPDIQEWIDPGNDLRDELAGHRAEAQAHHRMAGRRSEEHTSELQSQSNLVCRL